MAESQRGPSGAASLLDSWIHVAEPRAILIAAPYMQIASFQWRVAVCTRIADSSGWTSSPLFSPDCALEMLPERYLLIVTE